MAAVPPEGGYGWVVMLAHAFNSILVIQLIQVFGLIFKDVFKELEITGRDAAVIMNTNNAFSLMLGLFIGPILRNFGSRKTAVVGVLLVFCGMALTSIANSFLQFLLFYGFIMSAGVGLTYPSFSFMFNSYFKARRSLATGIAMTCTGTAAIFMPLLISVFMKEYGPSGTCLIFSALALNSLVGACLLHPIQWHQPAGPIRNHGGESDDNTAKAAEDTTTAIALECGGLEKGAESPKQRKGSSASLRPPAGGAVTRRGPAVERQVSRLSAWEASSIDLGRSVLALDGSIHECTLRPQQQQQPRAPVLSRWLRAVAEFFDLSLLQDPVFVNMVLGISFAFFAEINFSVFLPFVLAERGFGTQQIAAFLSVMAVADTVCRFLAPFLHRLLGWHTRLMYTAAICSVVAGRIALLYCWTELEVTLAFVALGVTKGFRVVFYAMVIPDAVPIERLPCAQGIQSLVNGIVFLSFGPLIGWLRDYFGTYEVIIVSCSIVSAFTLVMWATEFVVRALVAPRYKAVSTGR